MKVPKSPYLEEFILKITISEQFLRMSTSDKSLADTNNPKYFPQGFAGGPILLPSSSYIRF